MENSLLCVSLEKLAVKIIKTLFMSLSGHLLGPQEVGVRWGVEMVALLPKGAGWWAVARAGAQGGPRGRPWHKCPTSAALAEGNPRPLRHLDLHLFDGIPSIPVLTLHLSELVLSPPVHWWLNYLSQPFSIFTSPRCYALSLTPPCHPQSRHPLLPIPLGMQNPGLCQG